MFNTPKLQNLRRKYEKVRKANSEVLNDAGNSRWTNEFWTKWWPKRVDQEAELLESIVVDEISELDRSMRRKYSIGLLN